MIQQADSKPGEQRLEELRKTRIDSVEHKATRKSSRFGAAKGCRFDISRIYLIILFLRFVFAATVYWNIYLYIHTHTNIYTYMCIYIYISPSTCI